MNTILRSSASHVDVVGALATTVTHARTLEELVRPLLELLEVVTGLESTYLTTIDELAGVQHVLFARNSRSLCIPEGLSVPWEGTLCKRALDQGQFYTDDVAHCWGDSEAAKALGIATYASTPVRGDQGDLLGTLCAASDHRKPMRDGSAHTLTLFAKLISQQMEREKLFVDLQRSNYMLAANALIDPVTHLPNRRALMEEMKRRLENNRTTTALIVAFIDLDHFKDINDQYGHDVGDRFLEATARRLQSALRNGDIAARLGGDEFVVLASAPSDTAEAAAVSLEHRLTSATCGRFSLQTTDLEYNGPSIGVVVAQPECDDAQALLKLADEAMYAIKRIRKSQGEEQLRPVNPRRA
ncbi:sensor domain-containing diguanylate cyclase [Dyella sp. 2HG41-7]|uniref:GGDEF domain-containing protein n=1 Tax=Dyella sp. 2HG41-7 TaxID=2883239 RepID=UPI001F4721B4|nr:sensor domain-containing diguanylate cyclase [Dyella sp. 2HG41-7]